MVQRRAGFPGFALSDQKRREKNQKEDARQFVRRHGLNFSSSRSQASGRRTRMEVEPISMANQPNSAKISTALADSRVPLYMIVSVRTCSNSGATSWVPAAISTTYCVPLLTQATANRKLSRSLSSLASSIVGQSDRCNHLSQHDAMALKLTAPRPESRVSRFTVLPSFLQGACSA